MNFKLIWLIWDLWSKLKKVEGNAMSNMGWKAVSGAILIGLGYAAKSLIGIEPALDQVGDALIALGAVLGGIGLRAAIAKVTPPKN